MLRNPFYSVLVADRAPGRRWRSSSCCCSPSSSRRRRSWSTPARSWCSTCSWPPTSAAPSRVALARRRGGRRRAARRAHGGRAVRGDRGRRARLEPRRARHARAPTSSPASARPARSASCCCKKFLIPFEAASFLLLVAAVVRGRARAPPARARGGPGERRLMDVVWFVVLSALIFAIGAAGVMTRRSPLVILLCTELMLNACNLALLAFARMHGQRRRPDLRPDRDGRGRLRGRDRPRPDRRDLPQADADRRRRALGAARLSPTTYGWLVLGFPLLGTIVLALGWRWLPGAQRRLDRLGVDPRLVHLGARRAAAAPGPARRGAPPRVVAVRLRRHVRRLASTSGSSSTRCRS